MFHCCGMVFQRFIFAFSNDAPRAGKFESPHSVFISDSTSVSTDEQQCFGLLGHAYQAL